MRIEYLDGSHGWPSFLFRLYGNQVLSDGRTGVVQKPLNHRGRPQWRGLKHFGEQFSGFGRSSFGICDWGVALSFLNTLRVFV